MIISMPSIVELTETCLSLASIVTFRFWLEVTICGLSRHKYYVQLSGFFYLTLDAILE